MAYLRFLISYCHALKFDADDDFLPFRRCLSELRYRVRNDCIATIVTDFHTAYMLHARDMQ